MGTIFKLQLYIFFGFALPLDKVYILITINTLLRKDKHLKNSFLILHYTKARVLDQEEFFNEFF